MNKKHIFLISAAIIAFVLIGTLNSSLFIIEEGEQAVIIRFGQMVRTIDTAGLNIKVPFIDSKFGFLKKIYSWNSVGDRIPTSSKQYIKIDTTARWRISNLEKFYKTLRKKQGADRILDQVIESAIKTVVGEYELIETVRSTNSIIDESNLEETESLQKVEKGRHMIAGEIFNLSAVKLEDYGIELIDVVIKRSNYSQEIKMAVLKTMISERETIAQGIESDGNGEKERILGDIQQAKDSILSSARNQAETIKGEGDAQATAIYNRSYSRSPEFFEFWRTMESYKKTMKGMDVTLTTDMDYFDYLYNQQGR